MRVECWADGSGTSSGPIGWAFVLRAVSELGEVLRVVEGSGSEPDGTNNRAELLAVVHGLEALTKPVAVVVISDSAYALGGFGGGWVDGWIRRGWVTGDGEPVKNVDLWKRLGVQADRHDVSWRHVKGHQYEWGCPVCRAVLPARLPGNACGMAGCVGKPARRAVWPLNERCDQLAGEAREAAQPRLFA